MEPVRVILFLAEPQRPLKELSCYLLRVFGIEISHWLPGTSRAPRGRRTAGLLTSRPCAGRPCGCLLGRVGGCDARERIVGHELITRRGERSTGRSCDPNTHDVTAQTSAPLGKGDVIRVP